MTPPCLQLIKQPWRPQPSMRWIHQMNGKSYMAFLNGFMLKRVKHCLRWMLSPREARRSLRKQKRRKSKRARKRRKIMLKSKSMLQFMSFPISIKRLCITALNLSGAYKIKPSVSASLSQSDSNLTQSPQTRSRNFSNNNRKRMSVLMSKKVKKITHNMNLRQ